jgi:hypothetical protein
MYLGRWIQEVHAQFLCGRSLGKPTRWEFNIKINLREIDYKSGIWVDRLRTTFNVRYR